MLKELNLRKILKDEYNPSRWQHSLGVATVAEQLVDEKNISVEKCRLAGLLHDYAKGLSEEKLFELATKSDWEIDETEFLIPAVLHAPVGADLIEKKFKIDDSRILEAVRFHTIGSPQMGILARIIFVADIIEPNREFPGVNKIRKVVKKNFKLGFIEVCNYTLSYNIQRNRILHPNTLYLRNSLLKGD